ncbi:uncharacterized protein LOC131927392 [Physella acuta]|uniref:uncharacterized protein LOC131927392 n=1 Tax=Physella acuta TaxID=109671 RepID=UPI0027DBE553|nr:uncharacterized protein LOC131927392 [Physella acuta]
MLNLSSWLTSFGVFVAWTVTSFLCHQCGKTYLRGTELDARHIDGDGVSHLHIYSACVLTTVQCITCFTIVRLRHVTNRRQVALLIVTHILSTLATNYSMTYIEAASVFAIKLLEPITMAVAHYFLIERKMNVETVLSIPVIIVGTLMFTGKLDVESDEGAGALLAFSSNILLTARNITLKKIQTTDRLVLNRSIFPALLVTAQLSFVVLVSWYHSGSSFPVSLTLVYGSLLVSGLFHVMYNYISTSLVLKVMTVVSHSIANIFKRLIVVLVLYGWGQRKATWFNFFGLLLATLGLCVYVYGKAQKHLPATAVSDAASLILKTSHHLRSKKFLWTTLACCCIFTFTLAHTASLDQRYFIKGDNIINRDVKELSPLRLMDRPFETNEKSLTLTTPEEVVNEAQRVLLNLLHDIIGQARHVMLMEIATYENKGDPAITAGEVMLLRKMNKRIVYYCETHKCKKPEEIEVALNISRKYEVRDLVILMQGGGNLVGYPGMDSIRESVLNHFPKHKHILFSQSIWIHNGSNESLASCVNIYSNRSNFYMFIRDKQSLQIAQNYFHGVKIILAPDMAFGLGMRPRLMPPYYDIVWLRRTDEESSKYQLPVFPTNVSVLVSDWRSDWKSNRGQRDMETSFIIAQNGLEFLQRGRIVVTDRLHGHILSTLMNIPHVMIDNPPYLKLSSFDKTWTRGLTNTKMVLTGEDALKEALLMLKTYDAVLPEVGPVDMNAFPEVKPKPKINPTPEIKSNPAKRSKPQPTMRRNFWKYLFFNSK